MSNRRASWTQTGVGLLLLTLLASGCADPSASAQSRAIVVSFYPLQFIVERLVGDTQQVTNLTTPGVEPHDLELAPRAVASVARAQTVVYLKGFQPAVDEAVAQNAEDRALDVTEAAHLESSAEEEGHGPDETGHDDGHGHTTSADPHFWLDPSRVASVAKLVAARLTTLYPDRAELYQRNLVTLTTELNQLDEQFSHELATCRSRDLVTSHEAFGYLAQRYRFTQRSVSGIDPSLEPRPAALAALTAFVREHKVTTIYTESLASPAVARTLARETGARTAVLDPLEGLADPSKEDYVSVMRANLRTLRAGQGCS